VTEPPVPHRFELQFDVPGTPADVWQAIATAEGISAWMLPTKLEPRVGGPVMFDMGPEATSHGHVTAYEPERRFAYDEDWAALVGQDSSTVTPLATEFLIEARSGGTCTVRVVTSAYGTGAEWESEFFGDMAAGWAPTLDNLRIYLTHFPGQEATTFQVAATTAGSAAEALDAVRHALGVTGGGGAAVDANGVTGAVERDGEHSVLVRAHAPVPAMLSFVAFGQPTGTTLMLQGYLFGNGRADGIADGDRDRWQRWLDQTAAAAVPSEP